MKLELRSPVAVTAARTGERGSAYLFALLVLLVLTVLGLSLTLITQTEVQIGGAEKSANRVLYGADAGLRMQFALSRFADTRPRRFRLETTPDVAGATLEEIVDVSPFMPMYTGPCNLCTVNIGETRYWAINYAANAQSRRSGIAGSEEIPQANKLLSMMFFVQPEQERRVDESIRVFDPDQTADDPAEDGLDIIRY